ncbi:MAG: PRC-barrel domain-containing protein [Deltaproteobacteria bacterium]|nr:PRC-barrel domain-containing protein [Deltaproteobacteria bacterium]
MSRIVRSLSSFVGLAALAAWPSISVAAEADDHAYSDAGARAEVQEPSQKTASAAAEGWILNADRMQGLEVWNSDGSKLGEISEVLVDTATGKIDSVIVRSGGFFGAGRGKTLVPWDALRVQRSGNEMEGFVANVDLNKLRDATAYRAEMHDRQFGVAAAEPAGSEDMARTGEMQGSASAQVCPPTEESPST